MASPSLLCAVFLLEHLEHALGDEEPAKGVDGASATAIAPRIEPRSSCPDPAARMAPTTITELMALVTLMSGVWRAGVTFQTT